MMNGDSPASILFDSSGNPIGSILDGAIYRIQVQAALITSAVTIGTVNQGLGGVSAWKVDGSAVTQPISAVTLPLPTGAATETTLSTRLADATFTTRINTLGQKAMAASTPIVLASDQSTIHVDGVGIAGTPAGGVHSVQGVVGGTPMPISGTITTSDASVGLTNAAVPASTQQNGGTDGALLRPNHMFDLDTGAGSEYNLGISLRKAASGGSIELGTASDPVRVDPTGTTAQPVTDNGGSLTVDTPQLPAALVGSRLDTNIGAWLGSTTPTVGQKTSAASIPVVLASDQDVNVDVGVADKTTFTYGTSNQQSVGGVFQDTLPTLITGESGAARLTSQRAFHQNLRDAAGAELATAGNPLRIDPTGTTPQPISAISLPLPTGAATETTLALIKAKTDNLDVLLSSRAVTGLTDAQLRASAVPVSGTFFQVTQPVSIAATVAISAVSLPLPTGAATETTLATLLTTADFQARINTLGQKAMASSTPVVIASDQSAIPVTGPLTDTQLRATAVPVSGTVTANAGTGTFAISAASLPLPTGAATAALQTQPGVDIGDVTVNNAAGASAVNIQDGGNSITVDGTVAISGSVAVTGPLTDAELRATAVPVSGTVTANQGGAPWSQNLTQVAGSAVTVLAAGELRVGVEGLAADGAAPVGNPVLSAGFDGTNTQTLLTDTSGRLNIVGAAAQGAAIAGNPILLGAENAAGNVQRLQTTTVPPTDGDEGLVVRQVVSQTGTITSVASNAANVTLLAANTSRIAVRITNDGNKKLYVKCGATASLTSFTKLLLAGEDWLVDAGYTGIIDGIWDVANGAARVTEYS